MTCFIYNSYFCPFFVNERNYDFVHITLQTTVVVCAPLRANFETLLFRSTQLPIATQHWEKRTHYLVIITCSLMGSIQVIMTSNKIHPTCLLDPFLSLYSATSPEKCWNNWTRRHNLQPNCPCSISEQGAVVSQHSAWSWHGICSGIPVTLKYKMHRTTNTTYWRN